MFDQKITDIFFDLDHTLWDFEKNSALTFQFLFKEHAITANLEEFLKIYVPINLRFWKLYREEKIGKQELRYQRLRQSFEAIAYPIDDKTIFKLSDDYVTYLSSFNYLLPGTLEILNYLSANYRLHIITNGFSEIQEKKMVNANIRPFFDVVMDSEIAGVKKPNPKIFQLALKKARVIAEHSVMIGDNLEADILGAIAVGMPAIHLCPIEDANHQFSKIIHHLNEIKDFL